MSIELIAGGIIAGVLFWLQKRTSDKVDKLILQKAKAEREKKAYECRRIIEHLQDIHDAQQSLKTFLTNYEVGDTTKENLRLMFGMSLDALAIKSIRRMDDAIEQLQSRLIDNSLRQDFIDYVGRFNVLPDRILKHNMPQQDHQRDFLLHTIDEQTGKIKEFINRFSKEMNLVEVL